MRADIYEYTKDKPPHYGLQPPYAAVCLFRRPAGRPNNGNYLESREIRGNMLTRQVSAMRRLVGICLGVNTLADVLVFDKIPYNPI